jgi:nonsense-mediated mRNA decay protein 3
MLKRLKGLNKVRLIDASFIWTEPHSRRIKIKLTIQKQIYASTILQQIFQVEAIVMNNQCPDCARLNAQNTWRALVQVRQKGVEHKRTFYFLEQLILKHNAHKDTLNIKECKDGIDFFFAQKQQALHFISFLSSLFPVCIEKSEEIISEDIKSGTANFKLSYSVEIIPLNRNDLLVLPVKVARSIGNINPLCLVTKISSAGVSVIDPRSGQMGEVQGSVYWRCPFRPLVSEYSSSSSTLSSSMCAYFVVDIEPVASLRSFLIADITVYKCLNFDKKNVENEEMIQLDVDSTYITRSHLGNILKIGDYVLGYNLSNSNLNSELLDDYKGTYIPDVVLLKKLYLGKKKRGGRGGKNNAKRMDVDRDDENTKEMEGGMDTEYQEFLRELEEDRDLKDMLTLYGDPLANDLQDFFQELTLKD